MMPFTVDRGTCMNRLTEESSLMVPTARLDDFAYHPSIIKMDVEGGESRVLLGARRLIESEKPVLFIALHGREQFEAVTDLLHEFHYDKFSLNGMSIPGIPETDEIFALPRS
jgi:hypothetical protein